MKLKVCYIANLDGSIAKYNGSISKPLFLDEETNNIYELIGNSYIVHKMEYWQLFKTKFYRQLDLENMKKWERGH